MLSTQTTIVTHTGDGSNDTFPFAFKVFAAADLLVYTTDGATVTTLVLDTDYTVDGLRSDSGGNVITTAPVGNLVTITIKRVIALTQLTELRNQSKFYAATHEDVFDRLMMAIQQLNYQLNVVGGVIAGDGVVEWGMIQGTLALQLDLDAALALKAALASPHLTGTPLAPTAAVGTDTTQIATMEAIINERDAERTLTNVRLDRRVTKITSSATPTPDADATDLFCVTALAAAAAFAAPTGTPTDGQMLIMRIKDNGTARALTWNAVYVPHGVALPTSTIASKTLTLGFLYNTDNALNKWCLIGGAQEA